MGEVYHVLAQAEVNPDRWPYHKRFIIEDCETVHIHLNNIRLEFSREQFLDFAMVIQAAADKLKSVM